MKKIIVDNISKKFRIGFKKKTSFLSKFISLFSGIEDKKEIWALKNISFEVENGEILGIIGKNGSGKSSLLRIIAGIYTAESGKIVTNGKIISLINLRIGLKDRLTTKDNIFLCGYLFGLTNKQIKEKLNNIIEFAGLKDFVNTKLYQFSDGMLQRLAFSIAIYCNPEILLLDEIFEVGDENFKQTSAIKIKKLVRNGASAILVSHDLECIEKYCNKAILVDKGEIISQGLPKDIIKLYKMNKEN